MMTPARLFPRFTQALHQGFGVDGRNTRAAGKQAGQNASDARGRETAATDFFETAIQPGNFDVQPPGGKFDQVSNPAEKCINLSASGKIYRKHGREMSGPFAFDQALVVARGDDMAASDIGLIDPILEEQHMILPSAPKATI